VGPLHTLPPSPVAPVEQVPNTLGATEGQEQMGGGLAARAQVRSRRDANTVLGGEDRTGEEATVAVEATGILPGWSPAKGSMFPTFGQVPWATASSLTCWGSESPSCHGPGQSSWKRCLDSALYHGASQPLPFWWRGAPRAAGRTPWNSVLCLLPRSPSKENLLHS